MAFGAEGSDTYNSRDYGNYLGRIYVTIEQQEDGYHQRCQADIETA